MKKDIKIATRNLYKMLGKAVVIATNAHEGQFDKGGKPYILHPLHLMNQLMYDLELAIAAVLHDVIEDTKGKANEVTLDDIRQEGFSARVVKILELVTHHEGDSYQEYIDKISTSYDAIRVKRKDLEHNSDITRLKGVKEKDLARMVKYHKAFIQLGESRNKFKL